jgi:hypothetical protein
MFIPVVVVAMSMSIPDISIFMVLMVDIGLLLWLYI